MHIVGINTFLQLVSACNACMPIYSSVLKLMFAILIISQLKQIMLVKIKVGHVKMRFRKYNTI